MGTATIFLGRVFGKQKYLLRWHFFAWSAALGKILTIDNLQKWRVLIVNWHCMCKKDGGSINHLLLHCQMASELWSFVLCLFGVEWSGLYLEGC